MPPVAVDPVQMALAVPPGGGVGGQRGGQPGLNVQLPVPQLQPQQLPGHHPEIPQRRPGVPAPAGLSLTAGCGIHVGGQHEGLRGVAARRMILRQQGLQNLVALLHPAPAQSRHGQPHCPMGVLPAVFPKALAVAHDIAGASLPVGVGRVQQFHQLLLPVHQPVQGLIQSLLRPEGRGEGTHGPPALGDGIQPVPAAQGLPVGKVAPDIPVAAPGLVRRPAHLPGPTAIAFRPLLAQLFQQLGKAQGAVAEKPAQPYALSLHVAEGVVPVPAEHPGQAVLTEAPADAAFQRRPCVLQHGCCHRGDLRRLIAVLLMTSQRGGAYIGQLHPAQTVVPGGLHIFAQGPHQPQQVVGAAGAHAPVPRRVPVPPVHHVPFHILMAAAVDDLLPGPGRIQQKEIHAVLQLVPEAHRAAALIQAAPALQPAGNALIGGPAVHIVVQGLVAAAEAEASQPLIPPGPHRRKQRLGPLRLQQGLQRLLAAKAQGQHALRFAYPLEAHRRRGIIGAKFPAAGKGGQQLLPRQIGLRVFKDSHALLYPAGDAAAIAAAQQQLHAPEKGQAFGPLNQQHQGIPFPGNKGRDRHLPLPQPLFPHRVARGVEHPAGKAVIGGKETALPARHLHGQLHGKVHRRHIGSRRHHPHLPGIVQPQGPQAPVCGDAAQAAVGEDVLPAFAGQAVLHPVGEALPGPAVLRRCSGVPGRAEFRQAQPGRQGLLLAGDHCCPAPDHRCRLPGRQMHAAPAAQQGLQPHRGQHAAQPLPQGLLILALLVGKIHQIGVESAAFQQAEAAQQLLAVRGVALAAEDGKIAGNAVSPQLPLGRGGGEPVLPQGQHQLHGGPHLLLTHTKMHRGGPHHGGLGPAALFQDSSGPGQGLLPAVPQTEGEAERADPVPVQQHLAAGLYPGLGQGAQPALSIRLKLAVLAAQQAQPQGSHIPLGQPVQQQGTALLLRRDAQPPVGRVILEMVFLRQHRLEAQLQTQLLPVLAAQLQAAQLALVPVGGGETHRGGEAALTAAPAALLLPQLPHVRRVQGQQLFTLAADAHPAAPGPVDAQVAPKGRGLAPVGGKDVVGPVGEQAGLSLPVLCAAPALPALADAALGLVRNLLQPPADHHRVRGQPLL